MRLETLFATMERADVRLYARDGRLKFDAPVGAYTPELRALVAPVRPLIIAVLGATPEQIEAFEERAAIAQHDGGLSELAAEWVAHGEVFERVPTRITKEKP